MRFLASALLLFSVPALADVVPKDCVPRFPAEEMDACGRDRAVVIFHNACGTAFPDKSCHLRVNPGLADNCDQVKACVWNNGQKLGRIAGHVLEWHLNHNCEGNQNCISIHKDLCLGRGDKLQTRRRLLRCSQKARNRLNGFSAQLFQAQTGTGQDGRPIMWGRKFGEGLAEEVAAAPPGADGGPPGVPGQPDPVPSSSTSGDAPGRETVTPEQFERLLGLCLDKAESRPEVALACLKELRSELRERRMRGTTGSKTR